MAPPDPRQTDVIERAIRQTVDAAAEYAEDELIGVVTSEINVSRELVERESAGREASERDDQGISVEPTDGGFTVIAVGDRLSLKRFNPRQTEEGVEYDLGSKSPGFAPGAFIAQELGGHVFRNTGEGRRITKLHGPSIPEVLRQSDQTEDVLLDRVPEFFRAELESRLRRDLASTLRVDRTS